MFMPSSVYDPRRGPLGLFPSLAFAYHCVPTSSWGSKFSQHDEADHGPHHHDNALPMTTATCPPQLGTTAKKQEANRLGIKILKVCYTAVQSICLQPNRVSPIRPTNHHQWPWNHSSDSVHEGTSSMSSRLYCVRCCCCCCCCCTSPTPPSGRKHRVHAV